MHIALLVTCCPSSSAARQGRHLGHYKRTFSTEGRGGLESLLWLTPNHVRPAWPPCFPCSPPGLLLRPHFPFPQLFPVPCCSHIPKDSVPLLLTYSSLSQIFCCLLESNPLPCSDLIWAPTFLNGLVCWIVMASCYFLPQLWALKTRTG